MKFGIHNPSWVYGLDPAEAFEAVKAKAQWAEDHGFVWFSVMDHLIQIGGVGAPDEPFMEGWTVLAALAAVTSRIRLATLATSVGYRNPAHLSKIAATVDLISRGRLTLGIGAGYLETEYRQYGWEFPARPAVRIRQMEEAVRLILAMWTEKRTTFHGRYFHVEDAILEPKPVQRPRPPVMIAGGGEQLTLRAVARLADACNIGGDPDTVRHKLTVLRGHCDAAQRDYATVETTHNIAWPMDPTTSTVRNGSRLNKVLLLRLDPEGFDPETKEHAADGVVAYSAICVHTGCDVTNWHPDHQLLECPCHYSTYDPKEDAKVVSGPAPRRLPALPLKIVDSRLVVAKPFTGRAGFQQM